MTRSATLLIDPKENRIAVTIDSDVMDDLLVAGLFTFAPKLFAAARVVDRPTGGEGFVVGFFVHPRQHQHFPGVDTLRDGCDQPILFGKVGPYGPGLIVNCLAHGRFPE